MRMSNKLVLGLLTGALLLCLGAGTASALNSLGASATAITGTASNVTFNGTFGNVICNVTLQGTLASRIAKVAGTTAGKITAGSAGGCTAGGATLLIGTGWTVRYTTFGGTLPTITSVDLTFVGASFNITLGSLCVNGLYRGDIVGRASATDGSTSYNRINANSTIGTNTATKVSGPILCPTTGTITGAWTITPTTTVTLH